MRDTLRTSYDITCKDEVGAAKSIKLNGILSFVNCFVFFTLGVALWTFYQSHADKIPVLAKEDQMFPWFIAHELPVGFFRTRPCGCCRGDDVYASRQPQFRCDGDYNGLLHATCL